MVRRDKPLAHGLLKLSTGLLALHGIGPLDCNRRKTHGQDDAIL
jgi:hypothetical protein